MRVTTAISISSFVLCASFANAQNKASNPPTLYIGDKAPAFKPLGAVKGNAISAFKKGKTYVVEFWATWCGPCINAMPHLSDVADKYKGKVDFYGVNTWDFNGDEAGVHTKKVSAFVTKNTKNMRYNVVLDDEKDTISKSWIYACGRNGIPCAFIVNDEGKVAWMGSPLDIEAPLKAITEKKWDLSASKANYANKEKAEKDAAEAKAAVQAKALAKALDSLKAGNQAEVEAYIEGGSGKARKIDAFAGLASIAPQANPDLLVGQETLVRIMKKYEVEIGDKFPEYWCQVSSEVVFNLKDPSLKKYLVNLCSGYVNSPKIVPPNSQRAAIYYTYLGRMLHGIGDKESAVKWYDKATAALPQCVPSVGKYFADLIEKFRKDVKS